MQEFRDLKSLYSIIQTHAQYSNQIKLKRLKKQFQILQNYENDQTTIQKIFLSSIGIELLIINRRQNILYQYKMILGFQYPFNKPHLNYLKKGHQLAKCKDLLDNLIDGNKWGPSFMIASFLDKISYISKLIQSRKFNQLKSTYNCSYQSYRKNFLKQMGIQLYNIEEYTWKYLIKSTKKRILGLTDETFFIFQQTKTQQNLNLIFYKQINQLTTAKASVKGIRFNLQVTYSQGQKQSKLYFGGNGNIEQILSYLNPIKMLQRDIQKFQKQSNSQFSIKGTQIIQKYTQLIEYYSQKDPNRAENYMKRMKSIINNLFENHIKIEPMKKEINKQIDIQEIQT